MLFKLPATRTEEQEALSLADYLIAQISFQGREYAMYVEIGRQKDNVFLPYYMEERLDYVIDRSPYSRISYSNRTVFRRHDILHWGHDAWNIIVKNRNYFCP